MDIKQLREEFLRNANRNAQLPAAGNLSAPWISFKRRRERRNCRLWNHIKLLPICFLFFFLTLSNFSDQNFSNQICVSWDQIQESGPRAEPRGFLWFCSTAGSELEYFPILMPNLYVCITIHNNPKHNKASWISVSFLFLFILHHFFQFRKHVLKTNSNSAAHEPQHKALCRNVSALKTLFMMSLLCFFPFVFCVFFSQGRVLVSLERRQMNSSRLLLFASQIQANVSFRQWVWVDATQPARRKAASAPLWAVKEKEWKNL